MKIVDSLTGELYYGSKDEKEEFPVTGAFWRALVNKEIRYLFGGKKRGVFYTEVLVLDLKSKKFEEIFSSIAKSEKGKEVLKGLLPVDTVL